MKTKRVNSQALIEAACCILFAVGIFYLVSSGKYLSYVTPRMKPYLYLTSVAMLLWAAASLAGLFRFQYRKRPAHCFLLLLPILLLALPHGEIGMSNLSGSAGLLTGTSIGGLAGAGGGGKIPGGATGAQPESSEADGNPDAAEDSVPAQTPGVSETPTPSVPQAGTAQRGDPGTSDAPAPDVYQSTNVYGELVALHGYDAKNKTITVSNDEFYNWVGACNTDLDQLEGFQITMTGAVFKDPSVFAENEFVPARLVMTCCVADLSPSGIVCNYDKASDLESDAWVTVTGTLYRGQYQGQEEPQIKVTSIKPAEPVKGYIFPYS